MDNINSTLQKLKKNVTYAEKIFSSGGKEDLQKKQQQINRVTKGKVASCFVTLTEDCFRFQVLFVAFESVANLFFKIIRF